MAESSARVPHGASPARRPCIMGNESFGKAWREPPASPMILTGEVSEGETVHVTSGIDRLILAVAGRVAARAAAPRSERRGGFIDRRNPFLRRTPRGLGRGRRGNAERRGDPRGGCLR